MNKRKVYESVERFKELQKEQVIDESRPSTSRIEEHVQKVDALIKEEQRITLSQVAAIADISYRSAQAIVHDDLGYHKVCAR